MLRIYVCVFLIAFLVSLLVPSLVFIYAQVADDKTYSSSIQDLNYTELLLIKSPVDKNPAVNAVYALLVTITILVGVFGFLWYAMKKYYEIKYGKDYASSIKEAKNRYGLSNLLVAPDGWPSLSYFQFLLWTCVIASVFIFIYFFRIFSGVLDLYSGPFPDSLMGLIGISAMAVIGSRTNDTKDPIKEISNKEKIVNDTIETDSERKNKLEELKIKKDQKIRQKASLWSMFYDSHGNITLNRLQMFLWTIASVIIYIVIFYFMISNVIYHVTNAVDDFKNVKDISSVDIEKHKITIIQSISIPDIDQVLLVLMGISQASYVGGKVAGKITESKKAKNGNNE